MKGSDDHTRRALQRLARPLHFIRVRLYRGGQAEFVKSVLEDERDAVFDDLSKLRAKGLAEEDEKVVTARDQLVWLINAIKDISVGMIELAGPNEDPR